jgi:hypothetical protein
MVSISLSLNVLPQLATSRIATDVVRGQFVLVTNYFVVLGKGRQRLPAPMGNPFGIALSRAWAEWAAKQGVPGTASLPGQGEQRRSSSFNIRRDISRFCPDLMPGCNRGV